MVGERIAIEFRRRSIPKTFDVVPDVQPAKYLFWVNNHRIEQRRITSASPRTTDGVDGSRPRHQSANMGVVDNNPEPKEPPG